MASTVTSRPNHYEVLGLTSDATSDEIAQAFARELSLFRPRPFGSLTDVTIAYETLRHPARRKAYDRSLGLAREPLRPAPMAPADWKPFLARPSMKPAEGFVIDRPLPPAPAADDHHPLLERLAPAPPATAIMHTPIRPEASTVDAISRPEPKDLAPPAIVQETAPDPEVEPHRPLQCFEEEQNLDRSKAMRDWRLPAAGAGALILAVVVGAWTGWNAGSGGEPQAPQQSVKVAVPRAKPAIAASEPALSQSVETQQPQPQAEPVAAARPAHTRQPLQIALPEEQEAGPPTGQAQAEQAAEQPAGEPQDVPATSAELPLPNAVITRTIGRIGYSCGQIASATPVGSDGVFTVTCTSGHSYRASSVRGRYHFRRLN
jgi:hypothetical protein